MMSETPDASFSTAIETQSTCDVDDLVLVWDAMGCCQTVLTSGTSPMLNCSHGKLLGRTLPDFFPQPVAAQLLEGIQAALQTAQTVKREFYLKLGDRVVAFAANLSPIASNSVLGDIRAISTQAIAAPPHNLSTASTGKLAQQLHTLLEHIPDIVSQFDRDLVFRYINPAILPVTGLHPHELLGKRVTELDFPSDVCKFWEVNLRQVFATGETMLFSFHFPTSHSGGIDFQTRLVPEFDAEGTVETVLTISRDITDLKQTEAALRQSKERFRQLFEDAPIAIALARANDGQIVQTNQAHHALLGYTISELSTMSFADLSHPADLQNDLAQVEQLLAGTISSFQMEKRFFHQKGHMIWTRLTATLICRHEEGIDYVLAMLEDITERKQAEQALQESERRFRALFDSTPMPVGVVNVQTRQFIQVNAAHQAWLGYSNEDLAHKTFLDITHPDDRQTDDNLSSQMQSGEIDRINLQKRLVKKSGDVVWAEITAALIRDECDRPLYSLCTMQDVTQAKQLLAAQQQAEAALRQQSQRDQLLRTITQQIHQSLKLDHILAIAVAQVRQILNTERVLVFQLHPDGTGEVLQEAIADHCVRTQGDNWHNVQLEPHCYAFYQQGIPRIVMNFDNDDCAIRPASYLRSIGTRTKMTAPILQVGEPGMPTVLWGLLIVHSCDPERQWHTHEADLLQQIANQLAIALQQATLYQQSQIELGERQQAEANLRSLVQEKDVLLKEVHHRVKNNLQIISSLLRMQSRLVDSNTRLLFQEAQNRVQSIASIHEHLYQSPDLSQLDFEEYVQILVNNLLRSYGVDSQTVQTVLEIEPIPLTLNLAIPCGLIINELVSNSLKYAFEHSQVGEIKICLAGTSVVKNTIDNKIILTVQDNGVGISPNIDWQTSRSLGLRIVRTLVGQMHGVVTLERDRGTVFRITLPLTDPASNSN